MQHLLIVPEVARLLRVKPSTVYGWIRSGKLEHLRVGRLIRITPEQIENFVAHNSPARFSAVTSLTGKEDSSCL
jgi:excisionase family DNA binding protein